jgi:hypothetical protein
MDAIPALSVVLPTLDESDGLKVLLPRLSALFKKLGVGGEILVVDGGSKDDTVAVAESLGARVVRQKGRGFGSAVREGLRAARAEYVALMDADGSHEPEELENFWARRSDAELIVGSRYCSGGSAHMAITRQFLSRALNIVSKRVLDLPVCESSSGFRLYRREAALAVKSDATDFSIQQDLLVGILSAGGRVIELPIHYAPRLGGRSKANAWKLAPAYVRLLLRLKPQRGGWLAEASLAATLGVALAAGLCGITGGLPGSARLRALPPEVRGSPEFAAKLADAWRALYREIERSHAELRPDEPHTGVSGVVEVPPGWTFPPDALINSARALLTQSIYPDEKKSFIILARMRPWRLEFEPLYAQYGGTFIYPLGAFLATARLFHLAVLTPDLGHYLASPDDMRRLYLLGRLFVLLFHLGTVWLLYEFGRVLAGRWAGAAAGLLWTLSPLAVVNAHLLKPHPVATFWFLAAAYCAARAVEDGHTLDYLLCGLFAGAAAGGSLALGYGLGIPVLARLVRREGEWLPALGASAAGLAAVVLTNPYLFFSPRDFAWELTVFSPPQHGFTPWAVVSFLHHVVPVGFGPVLAALAVAGVARGLFADARRRVLALVVLVGGLVVLLRFPQFASDPSELRLHYAAAVLAVLLAADLVAAFPRRIGALLLLAALVDTGLRGGAYLENLRREAGPRSTRTAAADWVDANIPAGATVGTLLSPEPSRTPPFRWDRVRLEIFETAEALNGRELPEWVVAHRWQWGFLDADFRKRYDEVKVFAPETLAWAKPTDASFFSNAAMVVLRRAK